MGSRAPAGQPRGARLDDDDRAGSSLDSPYVSDARPATRTNRKLAPLLVFLSYAMLVRRGPLAARRTLRRRVVALHASGEHWPRTARWQAWRKRAAKAMVGERPASSLRSYEDMLASIAQTNRWVQSPGSRRVGSVPAGGPECVRPLPERLSALQPRPTSGSTTLRPTSRFPISCQPRFHGSTSTRTTSIA
jgi:hypothetical protein